MAAVDAALGFEAEKKAHGGKGADEEINKGGLKRPEGEGKEYYQDDYAEADYGDAAKRVGFIFGEGVVMVAAGHGGKAN